MCGNNTRRYSGVRNYRLIALDLLALERCQWNVSQRARPALELSSKQHNPTGTGAYVLPLKELDIGAAVDGDASRLSAGILSTRF